MHGFRHHRASYGAELDVNADAFFEGAADWTGILDYLPDWHPFKFTHVSLGEGCEEGRFPITRLMHLDKSSLPEGTPPESLPDFFRETLLAADAEAGTLNYRVEGETLGMRNYFAVKEIETLGPDRCKATINARFDFPEEADAEPLIAALMEVYRGVIHGIEAAKRSQTSN